MGKGLLLISGGINVDPNDLTATQGDIMKGKTALVNGSDEPVSGTLELTGNASTGNVLAGNTFYTTNPKSKQTGTMKDWRGTPQHIDARRINNSRFEVAVAAGYHGYNWASNSYEYMDYSEVASTLGLTAAKLAQGQSVCGLSGTYKGLGNAAATDVRKGKTFSTVSLSNATGTMPEQGGSTTTPGTTNKTIVSANRYVTGNIVVAGNSNLTAGNIKKGVNIFGVTGSWEGYVAAPTDLYKYGAQGIPWLGFKGHSNTNDSNFAFESNQILLFVEGDESDDGNGGTDYEDTSTLVSTSNAFNLTGYKSITLTINVIRRNTNSDSYIELGAYSGKPTNAYSRPSAYSRINGKSMSLGQKTLVLDVSAINATRYIGVRISGHGYGPIQIYVYQVSVS